MEKPEEKKIKSFDQSQPLTEGDLKREIWPLFSRAIEGDRERNEIYLANHSLGRPLDQTALDIQEGLQVWYASMDRAWDDAQGWQEASNTFRNQIAQLFNLPSGANVIPKNNAGQGLRAVLNAFPQNKKLRVVATTGEFDSADFILKSYEEAGRISVQWVKPARCGQGIELFNAEQIDDAVDANTDLLVVSQVFFGTGQILGHLRELIASVQEKGCRVILDVYHSAGIVPCDLRDLHPDFAMGGCYKYLRGGAGAGFLVIGDHVLAGLELKTLDIGWFAKQNPMHFERHQHALRGEGTEGWLDSTPPVIIPYQARAGLNLVLHLGIERIRAYSLQQQMSLRSELLRNGVGVYEPEVPGSSGGFSLIPHPEASECVRQLRESGVNCDARGQLIRLCPDVINDNAALIKVAQTVGKLFLG